jgi:hypothetical protein
MPVYRCLFSIALLSALAGPLAAGAQTPPPPAAPNAAGAPAPDDTAAPPAAGHRHRRHPSFEHALRSVTLTPAQQQQIAGFRDQEKQANLNADPATKRANAAKMRQQIIGILTPDQKTQLTAAMHRRPQQPPMAPPPGPAPSPGS